MRLYYLSSSAIPASSANSIHVMRMCRAFADLGHEVVLFARRGDPALGEPFAFYGVAPKFRLELIDPPPLSFGLARHVGARWRRWWRQPRLWRGAFKPTARYAAAIRDRVTRMPLPDLVYSRHPASLAEALSLDVPFILESHRLPTQPKARALERHILRDRNLVGLVTVSEVLREDYRTLFPWLGPTRVLSAHDGADPVPPAPAIQPPPAPRPIGVGYVGSAFPGKGVEVVVELARRLPEIQFSVVGIPSDQIEQFRQHASSSNLHFYPRVAPAQLVPYYEKFDIGLLPLQPSRTTADGGGNLSKWDSPLKLFEYMAYGKAIIASDLAAFREVIRHGETGLLVPPDELDRWAEAIADLAKHPADIARIGSTARNEFLAHYTWDARAKRVLDGFAE